MSSTFAACLMGMSTKRRALGPSLITYWIYQGLGLAYMIALTNLGAVGSGELPEWGFNWPTVLFLSGAGILAWLLPFVFAKQPRSTRPGVELPSFVYECFRLAIGVCTFLPLITHSFATIFVALGLSLAYTALALVITVRALKRERNTLPTEG